MLGSSQSIAEPNIALNTLMAEELQKFADVLEKAEDFDSALHELVCKAFSEHQRILFEGNGYSEAWKQEAVDRGLSNLASTAACLPAMISKKNIDLVVRHGIYTEAEFRARYAIHLDAYNKTINIEAKTMADMAMHQILPAALQYTHELCDTVKAKKDLGLACNAETTLLQRLSSNTDGLFAAVTSLQDVLAQLPKTAVETAAYFRDVVIPLMDEVRATADTLEVLTDKKYWPYPTYSDLLYY
jgi:glutamine synthetase